MIFSLTWFVKLFEFHPFVTSLEISRTRTEIIWRAFVPFIKTKTTTTLLLHAQQMEWQFSMPARQKAKTRWFLFPTFNGLMDSFGFKDRMELFAHHFRTSGDFRTLKHKLHVRTMHIFTANIKVSRIPNEFEF